MEKHNSFILIDYAECPPCTGLICVGVCPFGVLEAIIDGKPQIVDFVSYTQCGVCANMCPEKAITINQKESNKNK